MDIVVIIVLLIVCVQIFFFAFNLKRMYEFQDIFKNESSWRIIKDEETDFVSGIGGRGNKVFSSIVLSINKYLKNNSGSVIDFHLLKDAVDRHCDSVENDINTQTPIPLYCGLAGTMAGVICGLFPLITSGALVYLLGGKIPGGTTKELMDNLAATGINELLTGVAWAMIASICGILLTTINSMLFRRCKLNEESGKNTFLAWMQSYLLPELPSDTSDALTQLARNLRSFNNTFGENSAKLSSTFDKVNAAYRVQAEVIKAVHDMDVMKMAQANVRVLDRLQNCTDKLEQFNEYLDGIHGYTDAINRFTTLFQQEANRLHILEEIQQFFMRHKAEIAKDTADADSALREALRSIKDSSAENVRELEKGLVAQSDSFKTILKEEKEAFEKQNDAVRLQFEKSIDKNLEMYDDFEKRMKARYESQMQQIPNLVEKMDELARIPEYLKTLFEKVENTNSSLITSMNQGFSNLKDELSKINNKQVSSDTTEKDDRRVSNRLFTPWMEWVIVIAIVIMSVACVVGTTYDLFFRSKASVEVVDKSVPSIQPNKEIVNQTSLQDSLSME